MNEINGMSTLPKHTVVRQHLERSIRDEFGPHDRLPPERTIADDLGVNRLTVRRALDELERAGLIYRVQGAGTFVSEGSIHKDLELTSFSEDMRSRGRTPRSVWLKRSEGTVTPEEALRLRLSPGAAVYRFNRIRYADDMPMCLEYATIAASALPSLDAVDTSMYEALEAAGKRPVRALQRLSALLLNAEQARLLQSKEGDAGLCVERLGFLPDGQAVEFCRSYFRGDMYDFVAELSAA
jgi:GntR family transcriptional regulator